MSLPVPFAVFAVIVIASLGAAQAGEIADAGAKAENLAAQGQYLDALGAIAGAEDKIWQQAPLVFRKTVFVASEPKGFGIYDARPGSSFKRNQSIIIYAEPVGYGYRREGDSNVIDLSLDFTVKTKDGRLVGSQKNFAQPQLRSRVRNREFFIKVVYDFANAPIGDYVVDTTVNDRASGKSGSFAMSFSLVD